MPELILCEVGQPPFDGIESTSPFCLKVHRALKAAGLEYTRNHGQQPASHRRHNALAQVPVLLVDGKPIADSTRILAYIESLTANAQPHRNARARAEALLFEELADTAVNGFLVAARWADAENWERTRDAYFGKAPWFVRALIAPRIRARVVKALVARDIWRGGALACWERFDALLDQLEHRAPERGFWIDAHLSAADFALFGQLHGLRNELTPKQRDAVNARPTLAAYLDRVDEATRVRATQARTQSNPITSSPSLTTNQPASAVA